MSCAPAPGLKEGLGRSWMDPICTAAPPLAEAGAEKAAWGSPAHCGDQGLVSTVAWTPLLLVSSLSAEVGTGPGHQGSAPSLISPWGADSGTLSCSSCPISPVSVSAGSLFQPVLTQPVSLSASPVTSARLSCTLSSGYNVGDFSLSWFQQKPGSPPWYVVRVKSDSDKNQSSGVPSNFFGSKDASANAGLLLISGLQPEDEADYYCAVWHGDTNAHTVLQTSEEEQSKHPPLTPARGSDEVELRGDLNHQNLGKQLIFLEPADLIIPYLLLQFIF